MTDLSEKITIPSPLSEVWPLLSDPALVASCIPGATMAASGEDGSYQGTIRVKFGPTVATFRGEASLTYDHAAHRCSIEGRGIDQRGASRALASGTVIASGGDTTELAVAGSFNVTGPLETFANAGGVHVARALLAEFSTNMARLVAERRSAIPVVPAASEIVPEVPASIAVPSASAPAAAPLQFQSQSQSQSFTLPAPPIIAPPPRQAAAELSAGKLMWRVFLSWLRQTFLGKGRREQR